MATGMINIVVFLERLDAQILHNFPIFDTQFLKTYLPDIFFFFISVLDMATGVINIVITITYFLIFSSTHFPDIFFFFLFRCELLHG